MGVVGRRVVVPQASASPGCSEPEPPAPADSGPAPRGGRARTTAPDPGTVKGLGAELLRSARSLTVVRRFLRPDDAIELYRRDIERALLKTGRPSARRAAARAVRMRLIAAVADARDGGGRVEAFTAWIGGLREAHRRRPTVGQEFDREGL